MRRWAEIRMKQLKKRSNEVGMYVSVETGI